LPSAWMARFACSRSNAVAALPLTPPSPPRGEGEQAPARADAAFSGRDSHAAEIGTLPSPAPSPRGSGRAGIPPASTAPPFSLPSLTGLPHCVPGLHAPKSCRFLIPQEGTMNSFLQRGAMVALGLVIAACSSGPGTKDDATYSVPVEYHTLDNGLKVVLSEDRSAPTAVV